MSGTLLPPQPAAAGAARERQWTLHRPEPRNLWIRNRPRRWPVPDVEVLDLAAGALAKDSWAAAVDGPPIESLDVAELDDVVYLPPAPSREEDRRRLALDTVAAGLPLVIQAIARAGTPTWERDLAQQGDGVVVVLDLTAHLLGHGGADGGGDAHRSLGAVGELGGCVVAVPLLPGLVDTRRFEALADELVEHGVAAVHLAACGAGPATRRRLAAELAREEDYRALFHAAPPDERELGRAALARGLALMVPRPLPTGPPRLRVRRFLAGQLLEAGDLWARIEPSGREAAPYFRAARFVDDSAHDFESLARDGNLRVLEWLESGPRELVAQALRDGRASVLEGLRSKWSAMAG